jgi:hypothetical protein
MNLSQEVNLAKNSKDIIPLEKSSKKVLKFSFYFFLLSLLAIAIPYSAQTCLAQTYSWTDATGKTIYGTKPPKAATEVKKFNTKNLSRYSSKKVLQRLGWRASLKNPENLNSQVKKQSSEQAFDSALKSENETPSNSTPANLEHGPISLGFAEGGPSHDTSTTIDKCEVTVSNLGSRKASEVNVAFEFEDGTLIPATGPDSIEAGKTEKYFVPDGLLPLEIVLPETDEEAENSAIMPKVFLHGIQS